MIIKGRSRKDGGALGDYLLSEGRFAKNREDNEHVALWEGVGIAQGIRLQTLLKSFEVTAEDTQCEKPLYHVQMRTADGEHLTREQWLSSVAKLEQKLDLTGYDRVIVAHTQDGQDHLHVVWNRINYETGRAAELSHDALKRLETARELEKEFGLEQLRQGRDGKLSAKEEAFALRHGKDPQLIKDIIQTCWRHAENGQEFAANLDAYGMTLAKGDKRGFLVVDREGDFYLVSRTVGAREKEVREKFRDLDREQLPGLQQTRTAAQEQRRDDVLRRQQIDRNRLELKQGRDLERLEQRLVLREDTGMRQQPKQEEIEEHERQRAARLAATLYDRADLVSMQRDAMRQIRERLREETRAERQEEAHQRRAAGTQKYIHTAYERLEDRHKRQTERLEVEHYFERKKAGVVDPEHDRKAEQIFLRRQFDKAAAQMTRSATPQEQEHSARAQAPPHEKSRAEKWQELETQNRGQEQNARAERWNNLQHQPPQQTQDAREPGLAKGRTEKWQELEHGPGGKKPTDKEQRQRSRDETRPEIPKDGGRERTDDQ